MVKRARPKADRQTRRPEPPAQKPPQPSQPGLSVEAVRLFQRAMEGLQRHRYADAAEIFRDLIVQHPAERALLERSRVYLELCERELRTQPAEPKTLAERLIAATAALNNGDEGRAETLARAVLAEDARHDLALYLLAVIEARRGNAQAALSRLGQAIAISAEAGAQARFDPDFESLRDTPAFRELTDPRAAPASPAKRVRRGRGER